LGSRVPTQRQVESAAHAEFGAHIRRAREDGLSWHEIGGLLGLGRSRPAGYRSLNVPSATKVGPRAAEPWYDPPLFIWTCPACGQLIRNRSPVLMPAADGPRRP
jgi:hypothetical protein